MVFFLHERDKRLIFTVEKETKKHKMKTAGAYTKHQIKEAIRKELKKWDIPTLKAEVKKAARSNAPGSIFLFTFGLDELEERMQCPIEYQEFENEISELSSLS